ncbi:hypothetical protein OKA05_16230 [Luteolibacter arcticus]|uniref:Uncharacterized protein n=1 Tax=Luteolibacter arcticus TaxID=1581411 RepID=A0ABT3GKX9_9BACT|nr:hypothetical protein [Luteolibacter arcticus]MCW1924116.1 hypothetical protein [Luteolibacter arcticus]
MTVKEAVKVAIGYVLELFDQEKITNVGLEEVDFEESSGCWHVTVGFSRAWDYEKNAFAALGGTTLGGPRRTYKTVTIQDRDGSVLSVKNRDVGVPA